MTARTRIEAADAVVSVQAEGVDQATKKIKEVDGALGKLPAAAKAADAAAADSSKRWQELAGKVGAAVGAFASVQGLQLDTTQGLVGLAGVAAMATAALGPLGLAVTAAAVGVKLLSAALAAAPAYADKAAAGWKRANLAADEAKTQISGLDKATGSYLSTLTGADAVEATDNASRLAEIRAEQESLVTQRTEAAIDAQRRAFEQGKKLSREAIADHAQEFDTKLRNFDLERQALERRQETLRNVATGAAEAAGLETAATRKRAENLARIEDAGAARASAAAATDAALARRSLEIELNSAFEAARRQREQDDILDRADQQARAQRSMDAARAAADERKQVAEQKRGIHELQGALADFYQWKAEERQRDLDTAMAVNSAALNATVAVAGAFGVSEATMNRIKGLSAAADTILYGAKAYAAAGSLNPWSAVQYGLAAVAAGAASVAYFQAAGGGGGASASPSVPSGGGAGGVSAPPENRGAGDSGGTTINVSFDRAQRPLTRGDERAIYAGVSRALSGPGGARGLGSRRVAS